MGNGGKYFFNFIECNNNRKKNKWNEYYDHYSLMVNASLSGLFLFIVIKFFYLEVCKNFIIYTLYLNFLYEKFIHLEQKINVGLLQLLKQP